MTEHFARRSRNDLGREEVGRHTRQDRQLQAEAVRFPLAGRPGSHPPSACPSFLPRLKGLVAGARYWRGGGARFLSAAEWPWIGQRDREGIGAAPRFLGRTSIPFRFASSFESRELEVRELGRRDFLSVSQLRNREARARDTSGAMMDEAVAAPYLLSLPPLQNEPCLQNQTYILSDKMHRTKRLRTLLSESYASWPWQQSRGVAQQVHHWNSQKVVDKA